MRLVVRGKANQPVHTSLRAEQAVGTRPAQGERGALDSCFFARHHLVQLRPQTFEFGPPEVHPEEHFRPVLRVDAARSGVKAGHRVVLVILPRQQVRQLDAIEVCFQGLELGREFAGQLRIVLVRQEFVENIDVLELGQKAGVTAEVFVEPGELRAQSLSPRGIVPDAGLREVALELFGVLGLGLDVKGTPSRSPPA